MRKVPREEFFPGACQQFAYEDRAYPIANGQAISQPYTVAFMCQALKLSPEDTVLEIGTGSGYSAAVLSKLVRRVISIERIPELAEQAISRLQCFKCDNVQIFVGDGTLGCLAQAPYDAIVVTAAAENLPSAYPEQLCEGGRIVIPAGRLNGVQSMFRYTKLGGEIIPEMLGNFSFVPLIGMDGWYLGSTRHRKD